MISKFDICRNPEKAIKEIPCLFDKYGYKNNIIFFSDNSDRYELSELMFSCMSNMNAEKLTIDDKEFYSKFDINEPNVITDKAFEDYKDTLKKIYSDFYKQLIEIKNEELTIHERDDKLHCLNIAFRNEIEGKRTEFYDKLMKDVEDYDYTISTQIHAIFIDYCDRFASLYASALSFNPNDSSDPRNMIRKCPHCGLIWFKTEGCDGATQCGNTKFKNKEKKAKCVKCDFKYVEGKLTCIKNKLPVPEPRKANKSNFSGSSFLIID
jgi:hypothetical protein